MGAAASCGSDKIFVTSDNPRSEDAATIRAEVRNGCPDAEEIGDRRMAIHSAIDRARAGDVVLIAGKGHEQGQIAGATVHPFDDVTVASEALSVHA